VLDRLVAVSMAGTAAGEIAPGDRATIAIDGSRALCESIAS
jgi:hypothetical protein